MLTDQRQGLGWEVFDNNSTCILTAQSQMSIMACKSIKSKMAHLSNSLTDIGRKKGYNSDSVLKRENETMRKLKVPLQILLEWRSLQRKRC